MVWRVETPAPEQMLCPTYSFLNSKCLAHGKAPHSSTLPPKCWNWNIQDEALEMQEFDFNSNIVNREKKAVLKSFLWTFDSYCSYTAESLPVKHFQNKCSLFNFAQRWKFLYKAQFKFIHCHKVHQEPDSARNTENLCNQKRHRVESNPEVLESPMLPAYIKVSQQLDLEVLPNLPVYFSQQSSYTAPGSKFFKWGLMNASVNYF